MLVEDLKLLERPPGNHASFDERFGQEVAPAIDLMQEHLDNGFGVLFKDREMAERILGSKVVPAPMGNVAKVKEDGTYKHRLIQDLKYNEVNSAVTLHERQVLPRPVYLARKNAWHANPPRKWCLP